jgi:tetratricopeptide (TPR) repeat protein
LKNQPIETNEPTTWEPTAVAPAPLDLARGETVGRYVVIDRVGAGGMAVVYAAYDPELDRKVALKLLHPDASGSASAGDAKLRLLREAQATARLSHPNVVTVHDVGAYRDQVFIALEFVEGDTLWQRMADLRPRWREILTLFLSAGRGLAAAHAAGLVHRDFKPTNVLVGQDGRPRVADFGLARQVGQSPAVAALAAGVQALGQPDARPSPALGTPLTLRGAVLGTPAYMAPEQVEGQPADARSDQFSFCVALWEGLYGERPFAGNTEAALFESIRQGALRAPPKTCDVPARIRNALLRGLCLRREDRFPSMDALLAQLSRRPRRTWARLLVLAGAIAAASAATWVVLRSAEPEPCLNIERELAGVWDEAVRARVQTAFAATGRSFAPDSAARVSAFLDGYARSWLSARRAICEQTKQERGGMTEATERQAACLAQRAIELEALTSAFERADAQVVEKAVEAAHALSSVEACTDPVRLASQPPLPAGAETREKVSTLRGRLAAGRVLLDTARVREALEAAKSAVAEARAIGYRPAEAEALRLLGSAQSGSGLYGEASETLEKASFLAEVARHDEVAIRAANELTEILGYQLGKPEVGRVWWQRASALVERTGSDPGQKARLAKNQSLMHFGVGNYHEAAKGVQEAIAFAEQASQFERLQLARFLSSLGTSLGSAGQFEAALPHIKRAMATYEAAVGKEHPGYAHNLSVYGWALALLGRTEEALPLLDQALATAERALGTSAAGLGGVLNHRAQGYAAAGRYDEAIAILERARAIGEPKHGLASPQVLMYLHKAGEFWRMKGAAARALPLHEEAVRRAERAFGEHHLQTAFARYFRGRALAALGRYREARETQERAHRAAVRALGPENAMLGYTHAGLAEAALGLGESAAAAASYERGVRLFEKAGDPLELAYARLGLARALAAARRDLARARAMALEARRGFERLGPRGRPGLAETDRWLSGR